jgi:hypothetical protein
MARVHITINGFKGGQAQNLYDPLNKQTFQSARNLKVIGEENILTPLPVLTAVLPPSNSSDSDFQAFNIIEASDSNYYIIGQHTDSSANEAALFSTPVVSWDSDPTWTRRNADTGSGGVSSALEEHRSGIYYGRNQDLRRWGLDDSTDTAISSGLTTGLTFLRHNPGTGILHFIHGAGTLIGRHSRSDSSLTLASLTLTNDEEAVGIEPWGRFNIVGVKNNSKQDRFLIWDGSATTIDDVIPTKDRGLQAFRISGNTIHYLVSRPLITGGENLIRYYTLSIGGGKPKLIKEFKLGTVTGAVGVEPRGVDFDKDIFTFGFNGGTYSLLDQLIWAYGSGEGSNDILVPLRTTLDGATTNKRFLVNKHFALHHILIWRNNAGTKPYNIESTALANGANVSDDGVYQTNIFPLNNGLPGQIKRIYINHKPIPTSTGFTVKAKLYGNYPWGDSTVVLAEDTFTRLTTAQGTGNDTTGETQSTDNAAFTEVESPSNLEPARFAELQILFDEVNGSNAASIIFPLLVEVETEIQRP